VIVDVPWKQESVKLDIPDKNLLGVFHPNTLYAKESGDILVKKAVDGSFDSFIKDNDSILVIVNDGTRPTPTAKVLEVIGEQLLTKNVHFIIATGVHRAPTEQEYRFIFGDFYEKVKELIIVHDAREDDKMVHIGTTSRGTEFFLNKAAIEKSSILIIGSVEPHYFAGYSGGRKGLLPGISAFQTIEENHKLALEESATLLKLKGNPVHEDMEEAVRMVTKPIYTIMTVLDKNHNLFYVSAGDVEEAFYKAVNEAEKLFVTIVPKLADIVIASARYPMDVDLYQAQKALENGSLILKNGGVLLLVASCREGIGEEAFHAILDGSDTPEEVLEKIRKNYILGYHKAGKMAQVFIDSEVRAKTELGDSLIKSVFMTPFDDLQAELDGLLEKIGENAVVSVLPDGSVTVGKVKE